MASFIDPIPGVDDSSQPLQNQASFTTNGVTTKVVVSSYSDRHFVLVTQIDKVGTLITAQSLVSPDGSVVYDLATVFGRRDDPLLDVYARQIIERISKHSKHPLILGISLKEDGRDSVIFQEVLRTIETIRTW
mmetsp:Transcript_7096/g.10591  ORF Transcript_7096/g.10591 Transcript_7096/m.10591 type:complete len:133 (-) Transcript_7096:26-424(-)